MMLQPIIYVVVMGSGVAHAGIDLKPAIGAMAKCIDLAHSPDDKAIWLTNDKPSLVSITDSDTVSPHEAYIAMIKKQGDKTLPFDDYENGFIRTMLNMKANRFKLPVLLSSDY